MVPSGASLRFLCAKALICGTVICHAQIYSTTVANSSGQSAVAGSPANPFSGSVPTKLVPGRMPLSLQAAIDLGLKHNLGLLLSRADTRAARGQRWQELSALLPHVTAAPYVAESKVNLAEVGLGNAAANIFHISPAVGPFSYFDARAAVSQTLFDWKSINAARSAGQSVKSADYTLLDAHDLVVLAVGYAYFLAVADEARIATDEAQVQTAQALFDQATDQVKAGTAPDIDALRSKVELQTRQQQLIQARNDFAIQKITVARVIGLAPSQEFDLTEAPYQPLQNITVDEALSRAYASRSDYRAALTDVRAAELSRKAAVAGYFPSLSLGADYGTGGAHPSDSTRVYDLRGTLSIPIFTGNSVHGDIQQADARLEQSRERLDNLRAQIEADVRTALLNLESSSEQVNVARSNIDLADQTLAQSRDRFTAGVTDTVEVVQSQQAVASAHEQYISSLYSYNSAKISLIRALGAGEQGVKQYFSGK